MKTALFTLAAAASFGSLAAHAATEDMRATARQLSEERGDAVVWMSVIAKTSMSVDGDAPAQIKQQLAARGDQETTNEATATFISEDGLMVTALAQLDQSSMVDGRTINTPSGAVTLNAESEIQEILVIMPDGTEIPADLVLKDADLGLGFIRLRMDSDEAEGVEITAIDLADSAEAGLLDECVTLGRLDESLNREVSVVTSEISGMTTSPRTFYRIGTDSIGCPVYLKSGKLLGITIVRKPSDLQSGNNNVSPVVLPAEDVARIAEQAVEAEPEAGEAAAEDDAADAEE